MGMTPGNKPPSAPAAELLSAQWESERSQRARPADKSQKQETTTKKKRRQQSFHLFGSDPALLSRPCVDPLQQLATVAPLCSPAADFTADAA